MSVSALQHFFDVLNDSSGISDPRMNGFLMKSPLQLFTIIALYLTIVFKIGPKLMQHRQPYSLRNTIIVYNIFQIFLNAYIFLIFLRGSANLNLACWPPAKSNDLQELRGHYYYILLKYLDLIETVFYVLRKKNRQISFLHVYHHIGILTAAWISGKYFPGGQGLYVGIYNTVIHCIMYCYYLMSSWSPNNSKVIWWKKYVTVLQIIQHCMIFFSIAPAVLNVNCSYPKGWMGLFSVNVLVIIYLFGKFYKDTYLTKEKIK